MKNQKIILSILIFILIVCHIVLGLLTIHSTSATYDEGFHLTAGYTFLRTGDLKYGGLLNPPASETYLALPLLLYNPGIPFHHPFWSEIKHHQYPFADLFLFQNNVDAEKMLFAGRYANLLLSTLLCLLVFFWAYYEFGMLSGLLALVLSSFSSVFVGNGSVATTDISLTLFYFASFYFLRKWYGEKEQNIEKNRNLPVLAGISLAFTLLTKYSSIAVFPVLAIMFGYFIYEKRLNKKYLIQSSLFILGALAFTILVLYRPDNFFKYYFQGLNSIMADINRGRSTFLLGEYSTKGWLHYFPVVFLLKTPIQLLIILIAAAFIKEIRRKEILIFIGLPVAVYFGMACFSKMQIGHRHIIPIYPFLMVFASSIACKLNKNIFKLLIGLVPVFYIYGAVKVHPWHLSYFNEFIGSTDNAYKYLTDANVDWGHGLKDLKKYLDKQGVGGIYLNYFGTSDPHYYGIKYVPIGFVDSISDNPKKPVAYALRRGDKIDFTKQKKVLFAISVTNLQATYYAEKEVFKFLKEIEPEAIIAHSIMVYDMKKHPDVYNNLKKFLK